jgi:hypothetical protein
MPVSFPKWALIRQSISMSSTLVKKRENISKWRKVYCVSFQEIAVKLYQIEKSRNNSKVVKNILKTQLLSLINEVLLMHDCGSTCGVFCSFVFFFICGTRV